MTSYTEVIKERELSGLVLIETRYAANLKMPRHAHGPARFGVVLAGGYTEQYGGKSRCCMPATLVLHPSEESHVVHFSSAGARVFRVEAKPQWLAGLREHAAVLDRPAEFGDGSLARLSLRLYREFQEMDNLSPLIIEGFALEIVAQAARQQTASKHDKPPRWLEQARELLHAHFRDNLSLKKVAEALGVHPVYLAREFRKHYGCTLGEYLRRLRIELACRELCQSATPLIEIAAATGFYDQSHFSKKFKQLTGMTPTEYRAAFRSR